VRLYGIPEIYGDKWGGWRDVADHPPGGHDDVANATAAAFVLVHRLVSASASVPRLAWL
jgi:hypothetical protein